MRKLLSALAGFPVLATFFAAPARAEQLSYAYVGLSCERNEAGFVDTAIVFTDRTIKVRDADTLDYRSVPGFAALPSDVGYDLFRSTPTLASTSTDDVSCNSGPNRILVRHGASPFADDEAREWVSVWIGNRRILSRFEIQSDANPQTHTRDDAILIIGGKVHRCPHAASRVADCTVLGDAAGMGVILAPDDPKAITPGRIAATIAVNSELCRGLIKGGPEPSDLFLHYFNRPDNRDESYPIAPPDQDRLGFKPEQVVRDVPYAPQDALESDYFAATAFYDLDNDGTPQLVVSVSNENHYQNGNYLVGIPATASLPDAVKSAAGLVETLDDVKSSELVAQKGWRLFSGAGTQYHAGRYSQMVPGRIDGVTYILVASHASGWKDKGDDSVALLMKPLPDGSMTRMCEYHRGQPIY